MPTLLNLGTRLIDVLHIFIGFNHVLWFSRQWDDASPLDGSPLQAVMRTSTLGKSFSSATSSVRRNIFPRLTIEKQPERSLSDIQYTSINQFQQRVELYRGRYSIMHKNSQISRFFPLHMLAQSYCAERATSSRICPFSRSDCSTSSLLQHLHCLQGCVFGHSDVTHHQGI